MAGTTDVHGRSTKSAAVQTITPLQRCNKRGINDDNE